MSLSLLHNALKNYSSNELEPETDPFAPKYVNIGGFNIRYVRHVNLEAPTLVLLNGLPQSIRMWEGFWPKLSESFNLLAFDIPGFGLTKAKESDMSPRQLSHRVIQVMDHFGLQKVHLVGPDVGVPITLATAIEYPERLESINIFDGPGHFPPQMAPILKAVVKYRWVRWFANGLNKKPVMKTNFLTAVKDGYHRHKPSKRAINEYYQITHDDQAHRCAMAFFGSYGNDLPWIQSRLKGLKTPTLITWGKLDPFVKVSNAEFLSKLIPMNELVVFENASHFSSEDAGEEYLELITNWCRSNYKFS